MPILTIWLIFTAILNLPDFSGRKIPICQAYGTIYIEKDRIRSDFSIFVEDSDTFAQLIVFREENSLFADKPGLWYITQSRSEADFFVYAETDKRLADYTIYFTDAEIFAGCK